MRAAQSHWRRDPNVGVEVENLNYKDRVSFWICGFPGI